MLASAKECRLARSTSLLDRVRLGGHCRHQPHVTLDTFFTRGLEGPMPFPPVGCPLHIPAGSWHCRPEPRSQFLRRLRAVLRVLRETGEDDFVESGRQLNFGATGWCYRWFVGMLQ